MLDMKTIKPLCKDDCIVLTAHVDEMMNKRSVLYSDMVIAISNGEIIEQYENDKPFPSCLMLGYTLDNRPLHIVISISSGVIWVITTYYPTLDRWELDYKTRKAAK